MNYQEAQQQSARIALYRKLEARREQIVAAIAAIQEKWDTPEKKGPCGQGPFTGDTRESRRVRDITIYFTQTRGGAEGVTATLRELHIEAFEFGHYIISALEKQRAEIDKQMKAL